MSTKLVQLLCGVVAAMVGGYLAAWLLEVASAPSAPTQSVVAGQPQKTPQTEPVVTPVQGVVIDEGGEISANDSDMAGMEADEEDDGAWGEESDDGPALVERNPDSFMPKEQTPSSYSSCYSHIHHNRRIRRNRIRHIRRNRNHTRTGHTSCCCSTSCT